MNWHADSELAGKPFTAIFVYFRKRAIQVLETKAAASVIHGLQPKTLLDYLSFN